VEQRSRFSVLASGSAANASLLEAFGFSVLIDFGLPPCAIQYRLSHIGRRWSDIAAVILTHTHGDHWNLLTLRHLRTLGIPLYLHRQHADFLSRHDALEPLRSAGLLRTYVDRTWLPLSNRLSAYSVRVPHDSVPTFAFRFECHRQSEGSWAVGYASDLGSVPPEAMEAFVDVDLLALEFNHDVSLQQNSGRHPVLIRRVLGNQGHLSNVQAAEVVARILARSRRRPEHLIQLHLSHDCNSEALAQSACIELSRNHGHRLSIHSAKQELPLPPVELFLKSPSIHFEPTPTCFQLELPGFEDEIG